VVRADPPATSADVHIQCYQRLLDVHATPFDKDLLTSLLGRDFEDAVVAAAFECSVVVIYTSDGHNVSSVRVSTPRVSGRHAGSMKFTEHRTPTGRWTVAEFTSVLQRELPAPGLRLQHDIVMLYNGSHYQLVTSVATNATGAAWGVSASEGAAMVLL
jgi:hypothetical protein